MAEIKLPLIPLIPEANSTKVLNISTTINTQGLDFNESDNLCSIPSSSDGAFPASLSSSSSSSNCSPSSSTSLDSLSPNSDERDDVTKGGSSSRDPHLPEYEPEKCLELRPPQQSTSTSTPEPLPPLSKVSSDEIIVDFFKMDKSFSSDTSFKPPKRKGFFSCLIKPNGKSSYTEQLTSLRYLILPPDDTVCINLRDGYTEDNKLAHSPDEIENLLRYIFENKYDLSKDCGGNECAAKNEYDDDEDEDEAKKRSIADIICTSEVLTLIMSTPYNVTKAWTLIGVNVDGALIIKEKEKAKQTKRSYENQKFLEALTRRYNNTKRNPDGYEFFYTVSRASVGNHRLLYSSRITAAINKHQTTDVNNSLDSMIFAQTELRPVEWNKNAKSRKHFWCNFGLNLWCSTLLGRVGLIIFGEKEPGNWVKQIERFKHLDIVKQSKNWSPKNCIDFMDQIFTFIRESPLTQEELVPFTISFNPVSDDFGKVAIETLDESADNYIPSWFLKDESPEDEDEN